MLDKLFWKYVDEAPVTTYCTVGAVSLFALYLLVIKKKYKLPPGPRGLPLIGNLAALRNDGFSGKSKEWQKEYGDIITIHLGPMRMIVISDVDLAIDAYVNKSSEFSDRASLYSTSIYSEGFKNISSACLGDSLKYQKKVASQSLRQYLTGTQFEERCNEVLTLLVLPTDFEFIMKETLFHAVFQVIHGLCFESVKRLDDPDVKKVYTFVNDGPVEAGNGFLEDVIPLLRYWPTKKFVRVAKMIEDMKDYIKERIEERRTVMDKDDPRCLTDTILLAQQEILESDSTSQMYMTDTHAKHIVQDVIVGGIEPVAHTLNWIFLVLVAYPDIQERVHKEIDDVVGQAIPGREHKAKLVYTGAVLLEVMRLYAVAPFGVPHQTRSDSSVGGYDIPAKTSIIINQHLILRDPKLWEDPLEFKPERFLSEDGSKLVVRNRGYIPFSLGLRACPGESLAKLSIFYLAVGLLQKYSFSLPPGEKADFTPDTHFFGYRASDYKVIAEPRLIY